MTASLGSAVLALAFVAMVAAAGLALAGRNGDERWLLASRRAIYAALGLLTLCVVLIEIAFARDDFSLNIVQQHSSIETPSFYKLAAMWSSQEGSLLLWAWVLSIASSLALYATRGRLREIVPYATAVMAAVAAFFTGLMLFAGGVDPFATLDPAPALRIDVPIDPAPVVGDRELELVVCPLAALDPDEPLARLAVAEADGLEDVDGEVEPHRLEREERDPAQDVEQRRPEERGDEPEQAGHLEADEPE